VKQYLFVVLIFIFLMLSNGHLFIYCWPFLCLPRNVD
jgi:hypothetical protein